MSFQKVESGQIFANSMDDLVTLIEYMQSCSGVTYSRNILWCIIWKNFSKLPFDTYPGRIIVFIATRKLSCKAKTGEKNGHKMKEHWWSSKYINHFHAVIVFQFKKWVVDFICIYACVCIFSLSCFHLLLCNKFLPNTIYTNVMCHRLSADRVEQKQNVRKNRTSQT